ncbi:hypothetical protein DAETH_03320 [Deinococcus aetherius]|uniref:Uncharacterized protein n=1 Tax=Deinococcus aetherius TaxID=200252 RepID=A0ABN6RAG5_9DEIO|nr:hypothetical protein [Deinococcus aetherius]BDP40363.1 hypothetical protein DAETH_03320 [Deinococcus aetherius]
MTSKGQNEQKQHADGGDVPASDTTDLSQQEIAELNARPGRGARQVEGADPSDDFVFEHVEGDDAQGPKYPTETRQE